GAARGHLNAPPRPAPALEGVMSAPFFRAGGLERFGRRAPTLHIASRRLSLPAARRRRLRRRRRPDIGRTGAPRDRAATGGTRPRGAAGGRAFAHGARGGARSERARRYAGRSVPAVRRRG